ncbi:DMT family transporter [Pseudaminobacter sp. 19-2017]|uniref:DMT family transporter n=1 Tax=Pseudaminobacter soli (ex Zhang et al. 2022) TaxID=2831468 RepID=A0A942E161_9HYPH|nr:DMT family transporter [Pseudaminobacter soli]MBS3651924.1 DMT family transporter [Pseudaminobacter soli]
MRPRDVALAAAPPALWAIAYTIAKPTMQSFPPLFLMSIIYGITAIALYRPNPKRQTPLWVILVGSVLGGSVQSGLIFSGVALVPASTAVMTVQSQVPFAVLAAWAIGLERINRRRLAGIVLSLGGVALVVGLPNSVGEIRGLLMIVAGTLCWGIAQALIRARSTEAGGYLMGAMSALAVPQMVAMSLLLETGQGRAVLDAGLADWGAILVLAVGGFVIAYTIWYGLLRSYRVDQVAPFILLMPVIGVLLASVFLNEQPSALVLCGGAVILAGLGLVVRAPRETGFQTA